MVAVPPAYGVVRPASEKRYVVGDHVAAADEVRETLAPLQTVVTEGVTVGAVGSGLTVTPVVAVLVHVPFVAAKV